MPLFAVDTAPVKSCNGAMSLDSAPVSFPRWKEALAIADLTLADRSEYRREILAFLHVCKVRHVPATVILAKARRKDHEARLAMVLPDGTRPGSSGRVANRW
jgi:flavin reductase (DIM6/NTAB) family NADH-FMN oxidoreductase RutF